MAMYYVIQEANIDYNDEYNYTEGWSVVNKKAYRNLDKAKEAAAELEESIICGFGLSDFDNYDDDTHVLIEEFALATGLTKNKYGHIDGLHNYTWAHFIEWCEENGKNWKSASPGLVCISEIEVDNACKLQAEVV